MTAYSPSRLNAYRECPLKYRFGYVDGIRKPGEPIEAFTGTRVHETLQEFVDVRSRFGKELGFEDVSRIFRRKWDENYHGDVTIRREYMTPEDYRNKGLDFLRKFFEIESGREPGTVVGLEKRIHFSIEDDTITGYIDRLERAGNDFVVIDYKATNFPYSQEQADADWQLGIYELAVRDEFPEAENVTLNWYFLGPPRLVSSTRSLEQREDLARKVMALIQEIENATDFPPTKNRRCGYCDFQEECEEEKVKDRPA